MIVSSTRRELMMNAQHRTVTFSIEPGRTLRLPPVGGELVVLRGRVWLTHDAEPGDHVLGAGDHQRLGWTADAVVEPFDREQPVTLRWTAFAQPNPVQAVLRLFAAGLAARARSAASIASRTQGPIAWLDSMASSGTVK